MSTSGSSNTRLLIGLVLIFFGAVFFLDNFAIIPFHIPFYFHRWQWIFVIIGIILLFTSDNKTGGIVLTSLGLVMLFGFRIIWPFLLIGIGIHFLLKRNSPFSRSSVHNGSGGVSGSQDYIDDVSIFGGGTKIIQSSNFKGGRITAIFGGSEINFKQCILSDGRSVLDIVAIFGGTTLIIPPDWRVVLDVVPIFGGFSDNRIKDPNLVYRDDKTLVVKGFVLFGGGEIKT